MRVMGVSTSEVSFTLATTGRGDHKVHKGRGGGELSHMTNTFRACQRSAAAFESAFVEFFLLIHYQCEVITIFQNTPQFLRSDEQGGHIILSPNTHS
jgi:hypothetical protein